VLVGLGLVLGLAGCGARGELAFAPEAASVGTVETIYVSAARAAVPGLPLYTAARAFAASFARFDVAVPPEREIGSVAYPRGVPDPTTDFLVVSAVRYRDADAFVAAIDEDLAAERAPRSSLGLFVHGYNTNFAEGLYRQAQLRHDMESHSVAVHFAWPSAAHVQDYLYDRESTVVARAPLAETIAAATRTQADDVSLFAHSMGAFLLIETLHAMATRGEAAVLDRVGAVVLVSPDIEIDVFLVQAPPVLAAGVPIYLVVSDNDRALALSARIRGERERLGSIRSPAELGGLDVGVIDVSGIRPTDLEGHFREATSPALIDFIRSLHGAGTDLLDDRGRGGLLEGGVALVQEGARVITAPLAPAAR
jgi:esterase/lipase superfamily enzyme